VAGNKYRNKKCVVDGVVFDSKKEARRYAVLKAREQVGEITSLQRQVEFTLIPAHYEPDTVGKRGGVKKGKIIERKCSYVADFVYMENGEMIVEDTKGIRTKDYVIKRKMMYHFYGIRIREV
jgi:hypothetical protein